MGRGPPGPSEWDAGRCPRAAGCGQGCDAAAAAAAPRTAAGVTEMGRRPLGLAGVGPRLGHGRGRNGRGPSAGMRPMLCHPARRPRAMWTAPPESRCAAPLTLQPGILYKGRASACFSIKCPRCRVLAMMSLMVAAGASGCERRYIISPVISTYMVSYTWSMQTSW